LGAVTDKQSFAQVLAALASSGEAQALHLPGISIRFSSEDGREPA